MILLDGLREVPGLAALAAALPCACAFLLLTEAAAPWWLAVTTVCAAAALTRLLGIWCADPLLGVILAGSAAALGVVLQSKASRPDEDEAQAWAAGAGLLAALLPALLRFLGLNTAAALFLEEPLTSAVFVLGQVGLVAVLAAAAAARAARELARPAGGRERCVPIIAALAAAAAASLLDAGVILASAGAALTVSAAVRARLWTQRRERPLRARAFALAVLLVLGLASRSPGVMRDVWTARLDALYPGGRFLRLVDDGVRVRGVYEFSTKGRTSLNDGVVQGDDISSKVSLMTLRGQRFLMRGVLVLNPPTTVAPVAAAALGLTVALEQDSRAEAAALDALAGEDWRGVLRSPAPGERPDGLALFLPRPFAFGQSRRRAGAEALRALRARLAEGACAVIVVPGETAAAEVARVESAAREVFGVARTAAAGRAVLVAACPDAVETDHTLIYGRTPIDLRLADPDGDKTLAANLRWRPAPTAK